MFYAVGTKKMPNSAKCVGVVHGHVGPRDGHGGKIGAPP